MQALKCPDCGHQFSFAQLSAHVQTARQPWTLQRTAAALRRYWLLAVGALILAAVVTYLFAPAYLNPRAIVVVGEWEHCGGLPDLTRITFRSDFSGTANDSGEELDIVWSIGAGVLRLNGMSFPCSIEGDVMTIGDVTKYCRTD